MNKRVVIAGGGLAGLSLGIALRRRGVPVTVHEAGSYPRHKVCGEFVSGVGEMTLEELGVAAAFEGAQKLESARWCDATGELGRLRVEARGISRWRLDEELRGIFQSLGGELEIHSRQEPADEVIWAAGRPRREGGWIGLKAHALGCNLACDLEMHLGTNGYVGLARVEDGRVNVCGLFRQRERGRGKGVALLLETLRAGGLFDLAARLDRCEWDPASFCGVAGFELGRQPAGGFVLGDAAFMIPPFTGNGMSMAFESAACALGPALSWSRGEISWNEAAEAARDVQSRRFGRRLDWALRLHPFLTTRWGTQAARWLARTGCVPYQRLLALVR